MIADTCPRCRSDLISHDYHPPGLPCECRQPGAHYLHMCSACRHIWSEPTGIRQ